MKHIKTLGLLAVAVMALAAVFGTASASAAKFTAGKVGAAIEETTLKNHVFTITGSNTECTNISYTGATEALESESQMVTPSYSGCTAFGFAATITNTNCTYTLTANKTVHIQSTGGGTCSLTIRVNNVFAQCDVTVGVQNGLASVTYTNGAGDLVVVVNISKISAKVNESSGLCPLTVGSHTTASYTGESTVKAAGTTIAWDA